MMPTVLLVNGFRFFFYSNENDEPAHVHITKGGANGKVWLKPSVSVAYMYGFTGTEQKIIVDIVISNQQIFNQKWNEYFGE